MTQFLESLKNCVVGRVPAISIRAPEIERCTRITATQMKAFGLNVMIWSPARGFRDEANNPLQTEQDRPTLDEAFLIVVKKMEKKIEMKDNKITAYIFCYLGDEWASSPLSADYCERIVDLASSCGDCFIIISNNGVLPKESIPSFHVIDFELPSLDEIQQHVDLFKSNFRVEDIAPHLLGLSQIECYNACMLSAAETGGEITIRKVQSAKQQAVKKAGLLNIVNTPLGEKDVGGLAGIKQWLRARKTIFENIDLAKKHNIPPPKGLLLLGIPGTGKSLIAKATGNILNIPVLHFDISKVFNKFVGESEAQMRQTLHLTESLAPCVLWVDELEKGLAGIHSSSFSDSGVTARIIGTFLNWLQEKTSSVFVIATVNSIAQLPPELLRKGRFDEIFFVDLPTPDERKEIIKIHAAKNNINLSEDEIFRICVKTDQFTGSEIEQALIAAKIKAFSENPKECRVSFYHVESEIDATKPLAHTMSEAIEAIRKWARGRARKA